MAIKNKIEQAVRSGGYATKSEFFRDLFRLWQDEQLERNVTISRQQILRGRGKLLKSLKDLR